MSNQVIYYNTNSTLITKYNEFLVGASTKYIMKHRFDIGNFKVKDVLTMGVLRNYMCSDICQLSCSETMIKEKLNYLIIKNK